MFKGKSLNLQLYDFTNGVSQDQGGWVQAVLPPLNHSTTPTKRWH